MKVQHLVVNLVSCWKMQLRRIPAWITAGVLLLGPLSVWAWPHPDKWRNEDHNLLSQLSGELPVEGWVVWASNRLGGIHEIYLMKATGRDDADVTRLTNNGGKMPTWSPDGRWIAYHHTSDGTAHIMRWDQSRDIEIFRGPPLFWMADNSGVVCRSGDDFYLIDPDSLQNTKLFSQSDFPQLAGSTMDPGGITADGRWLLAHTRLFRNGYTADNGSFEWGDSAVILDLADPDRLYFFGPGCEPTAAPFGELIYHVCGDFSVCPTGPDLYQMNIKDLLTRASYAPVVAAPRPFFGHEYFPRVSTDNKWLVYGATTGCHDHENCDYEIFVHSLSGGVTERARITFNSQNDQWPHLYVGSLWSPKALPTLQLSTEWLSFSANLDHDPGEQRITVKNSGEGQLGQLFTSVQYSTAEDWLEISSLEVGPERVLINQVRTEGLEQGKYQATVSVGEKKATNNPQHYQVELILSEPQGCQLSGSPGSAPVGWLLLALFYLRRRHHK